MTALADWTAAPPAPAGEPAWLTARREHARDRFHALGFPTKKHEDWKHTSLKALQAGPPQGTSAGFEGDLPALEAAVRITVTNGVVGPVGDLPRGVTVTPLSQADPALLERHLGAAASDDDRALVALNLAMHGGGVLVHAEAGIRLQGPLHLVFATSATAGALHLRNVVVAERGSDLTVVAHHVGGGPSTFVTAVTEVHLGDNARVHHATLLDQADGASLVGSVDVHQGRDSRLLAHAVSMGGALSRTEIRARLTAPGASCEMHGLYLGRDRQHHDVLTLVHHDAPHTSSHQVFKGVLDERSVGVFNGKVVVAEDAQKIEAVQSNKNLVLADHAEAHTRPQLEIHADDVKCAHGATVGALDPESLFFLRARGIGLSDARAMLTRAFVHDVVATVPEGPVRDAVDRLVSRWSPA